MLINFIVGKLRLAGDAWCPIGRHYLGCMLYVDDIMLVCSSITAMQWMLDICCREAEMLDFSFNTAKSVALRIGPRFKHVCAPLVLAGADLEYVHQTNIPGCLVEGFQTV